MSALAQMGRSIRVAIGNQPRLMRDLLVSLMADQPDLEIVAEIEDESEIFRVIDETTPEFLIITLKSPAFTAGQCEFLLRRHPDMKILALAKDGNSFVYYSATLGIHATTLECSDTGILKALRANARAATGVQ